MTLEPIEEKWLKLWDELSDLIEAPRTALAAPFFSVGRYPEEGKVKPVILLVGKATHGCWKTEYFEKLRGAPLADRIEERREATSTFLEDESATHSSAFWHFYRMLQSETGADVIWTNLAKVGAFRLPEEHKHITCNPQGRLLQLQAGLAKTTLAAEISAYKPDVIYLVTGTYALSQIVNPLFCPDGHWSRWPSDDHTLWYMEATATRCRVLRTGHPSGKTPSELAAWVKIAKQSLPKHHRG